MFILVGLGNPGAEYAHTRHNAGFMLVDALHRKLGGTSWTRKFKAELAEVRVPDAPDNGRVLLVKPLTFMNLSGESVRPASDFYKVPPTQVVVAHDEMDLPLGTLRIKVGGGHGGHNGLRSLHQHLGPDYLRIRMGIGKPDGKGDRVVGHVLGGFNRKEQEEMDLMLAHGVDAAISIMVDGTQKAMNRYNTAADKPAR